MTLRSATPARATGEAAVPGLDRILAFAGKLPVAHASRLADAARHTR
jgi:hypothetical protein